MVVTRFIFLPYRYSPSRARRASYELCDTILKDHAKAPPNAATNDNKHSLFVSGASHFLSGMVLASIA